MAAVSCGTSHASTVKYTTLVDIQKHALKSLSLMQNHIVENSTTEKQTTTTFCVELHILMDDQLQVHL